MPQLKDYLNRSTLIFICKPNNRNASILRRLINQYDKNKTEENLHKVLELLDKFNKTGIIPKNIK